jgi:hypothetical protein
MVMKRGSRSLGRIMLHLSKSQRTALDQAVLDDHELADEQILSGCWR